MHTLTPIVPFVHVAALDLAIRNALSTKYLGVRVQLDSNNAPTTAPSNGLQGAISLDMDDTAQPSDDSAALAFAAAHDPVFLSADHTTINNATPVTITVKAPKSGAAAVTLAIVIGGTTYTQAVTMNAGVGVVQVNCPITGTLTISVQNPANRSTDSISVQVQ